MGKLGRRALVLLVAFLALVVALTVMPVSKLVSSRMDC